MSYKDVGHCELGLPALPFVPSPSPGFQGIFILWLIGMVRLTPPLALIRFQARQQQPPQPQPQLPQEPQPQPLLWTSTRACCQCCTVLPMTSLLTSLSGGRWSARGPHTDWRGSNQWPCCESSRKYPKVCYSVLDIYIYKVISVYIYISYNDIAVHNVHWEKRENIMEGCKVSSVY